jgi:hypothetical protein
LHVAGWTWAVFTRVFWSRLRDLWRFSRWVKERNSECAGHTRCSFLLSIVKITTGQVHDCKQTRVKTFHVHPATCNLTHWLTRHGSPTINRCFALPQLLYRWRHQSGKFWISLRIVRIEWTGNCWEQITEILSYIESKYSVKNCLFICQIRTGHLQKYFNCHFSEVEDNRLFPNIGIFKLLDIISALLHLRLNSWVAQYFSTHQP